MVGGTRPVGAAFDDLVRAAKPEQGVLAVDEQGTQLSFDDFDREVAAVAAALVERGVGPGSRVAWQLPTWLESLVLIGALARLGATQIPILPTHRHREVGFILSQARPQLFVLPGTWQGFDYPQMASEVVGAEVGPDLLICTGRLPRGTGSEPTSRPAAEGAPADALRWLFYTSGTTADPKGARHSDRTILAAATALIDPMSVTERDRMSLVFPISHVGGVIWLAVALLTRCTLLLCERFDAEGTTAFLAREGVTLAGAGTPFHLAYLKVQAATPGRSIFPDVRGFPSGAGPKPPGLHARLKSEIGGSGIFSGYGLTECPNVTVTPCDAPDEMLATSEGRPTRGVRLKIAAADGREQPPGVEGEIRVVAPQLFAGYVDASLDAEAFDADGFFRTGDLGVLDDSGYLRISGRIKDVIIRKGENISAKEIEDLLFEHPAVADVTVVGVPDADAGERCVAVAVRVAGHDPLTVAEIGDYLATCGLGRRKFPEQVEWWPALPRDPSGKVRKAEIRHAIVAADAPAVGMPAPPETGRRR
jgi:cyclohexanecarboxylate-CoA ligase